MRRTGMLSGLLTAGVIAGTSLVVAPAQADLPDWVTISNGTVQLGVWNTGELNVPAGIAQPDGIGGTTVVGLRYVPTGYESTADGCPCEGWGAADFTSGVTGYANQDSGNSGNLTVDSFTATPTSAVSTVTIDGKLRVTHDYHPSATPNLYEVTVTIENLTEAPIDPRYRRVMDWDIQPSAFAEYSTIQGTAGAANVLFASDDGFASSNPLAGESQILFAGDAVDSGPADHGALFDFGFAPIAPGGSRTFTTFFGAAANETGANAALATVGAEVYSYGQPSTDAAGNPVDPAVGSPNTFIFAFKGVGGSPIFPTVSFSSATYSVNEGGGSATITVNLSTAASESVTVEYATSNGTATSGSDYTAASGTLTFPAGTTTGTFSVPIIDDAGDEADETVNLTLSGPSGAGAVLGAQSTAVLTIVDNDEAGTTPTPPVVTPPVAAKLDTKVSAVSAKSKFKLQVLTPCEGQFSFRVQKRYVTTISRGSDEPLVKVTWKKLPKKYKTAGTAQTKTINLSKGKYRAVVTGKCGFVKTTTKSVTLKK